MDNKGEQDAYISGLVVGIELALLNPKSARQIADEIHILASQGDDDLRDELFDKAQALAREMINDRSASFIDRALESIRRSA